MLKENQIVYVKRVNNAVRGRNKDDLIFETTVEKIGNKYFYLKERPKSKFSINEMRDITEYCSNYQVYLTMQEIRDEEEKADLENKIKEIIKPYGSLKLSLNKLRKIWETINEEE